MRTTNKWRGVVPVFALLLGFTVYFTACDNNSIVNIDESLSVIPNFTPIDAAQNTNINVNKGIDSYFTLDFSNIAVNSIINNGTREGWCIAWDKPIASNGDLHEGLKLYSTFGDQTWKPVNYFLNIKDKLKAEDPNLKAMDFQVVIWSLLDYPKFDLHNPPSAAMRNGEPAFNKAKVEMIVEQVQKESSSFNYQVGQKYVVAVETPSDVQTVITVVDETLFALGQHSFRCDLDINRWGWVYEYDTEDGEVTTPLIAGAGNEVCDPYDHGGMIVGDLTIDNDADYLYISYATDHPYSFNDLHLWVGCELDGIHRFGKNPPPGQFPYKYEDENNISLTDHLFTIDRSEIEVGAELCSEIDGWDGKYHISAHAGELFKEEFLP